MVWRITLEKEYCGMRYLLFGTNETAAEVLDGTAKRIVGREQQEEGRQADK